MTAPAASIPTYPTWAVPAPTCTFAAPCGDCAECFETNPIVIDLTKVAEAHRSDRVATSWGE